MNTTDLLAMLAPHRDALAALGWEVNGGNPVANNVTEVRSPEDWDVMSASNASLIIESIVRRELDKIAPSPVQVFTLANGRVTVGVAGSKPHTIRMQPTRLAALLQLWSWCREVKG